MTNAKRTIEPYRQESDAAKTELALIEEWATLDRPTRLKRWDLPPGSRRKVLVDAFGGGLFTEGA